MLLLAPAPAPVSAPADDRFAPAHVDWVPTTDDWVAEFWTTGPGADTALDF